MSSECLESHKASYKKVKYDTAAWNALKQVWAASLLLIWRCLGEGKKKEKEKERSESKTHTVKTATRKKKKRHDQLPFPLRERRHAQSSTPTVSQF